MNFHGKGQQIHDDLVRSLREKNPSILTDKYGEGFMNMMYDNFVYPLVRAKTDEEQQEIRNKLDLFCAAFYNPIG